jgi:membrane protease YdiL (CAAX protease family)
VADGERTMSDTDATAPAPALRPPRWGLLDVAIGLVVSVVVAAMFASLALAATGDEELDDLPMWLYACVQATQWVGFVGVPVLVAWRKGNGVVRDFGATMQARDVPIGLAIGVGLQLVVVPLVSWPWLWLLDKDSSDLEERARDLTDRAHGFGLVMLTIVVVFGAPFAEELFFRGLALRSFERTIGLTLGLVASAVLFAGTHLDLLSFPALLVFGLVAGVLAQRTGRLGLPWWTHVGFNATTIALLVAQR